MAVHVLIDLDNLVDLRNVLHGISGERFDTPQVDDQPQVIATVTMNSVTASHYTFAKVQKLTCRILRLIGFGAAEVVAIELALVPTMPQTADACLLKLLKNAPAHPWQEPRIREVFLLTVDRGLGMAVQAQLDGIAFNEFWNPIPHRHWGIQGRGYVRTRANNAAGEDISLESPFGATPQPEGVVIVNNAGVAGFVSAQWPAALSSSFDLRDIVQAAENDPHLFTNFGPCFPKSRSRFKTRLNGIARLSAMSGNGLTPPPTLGSLCSVQHEDEMEYRYSTVDRPVWEDITQSAAGPGIVRSGELCTFGSRLSLSVLRCLAKAGALVPLENGKQLVNDRALIQGRTDTDNTPLVAGTANVRVAPSDDKMRKTRFSVNPNRHHLRPIQWWASDNKWWCSEHAAPGRRMATKSEIDLALPCAQSIDSMEAEVLIWNGEVNLAAKKPRQEVKAPTQIIAEKICRVTHIVRGQSHDAPLLALETVPRGRAFRAVQVHTLPVAPQGCSDWVRNHWSIVRRLPLLIGPYPPQEE